MHVCVCVCYEAFAAKEKVTARKNPNQRNIACVILSFALFAADLHMHTTGNLPTQTHTHAHMHANALTKLMQAC